MQVSTDDKVTIKEKVAYSLVNLGNIPVMAVTGSFLLIFYTNIVGLNPAACATLFLIARIFDAVNDPFIGYCIDRMPNTKHGHFRPVLMIGSILCALNFLLLFYGPMMLPVYKLGIAYVTYLLLGVLFPVMDISLNSMLPVMTSDMKERTVLSTIKGTVYMIGMLGLNVAAPLIIGDASRQEGYLQLVLLATAVIAGLSVIGALGLKERIKPSPGQMYRIKDLTKIITQRPVFTQFLTTILTVTGMFVANTVNTYFYVYIMKNLALFSVASMAGVAAMFPGMFLSGALTQRIGKKRLFVIGILICGLFPLLRLFSVDNIPILMIASVLAGFGQGIYVPHSYGMQADNTDYVELATGQRAEAAIASLSSFSAKFAMGIGGAIPGYLLAGAGFSADMAEQSASVNTAIILCVIVLPAVFFAAGALNIAFAYPLTREKLNEQVEELRIRRAK